MAAPEWDALKKQWEATKAVMLAAKSTVDKQAINPAEAAAMAADMEAVTTAVQGSVDNHTPAVAAVTDAPVV